MDEAWVSEGEFGGATSQEVLRHRTFQDEGERLRKPVEIRSIQDADPHWVEQAFQDAWGSARIVAQGKLYRLLELPGLIALCDGEPCGILTYRIVGDECGLISLNSMREQNGIGSVLIEALAEIARQAGCVRLWTITTNNNLHALGFYQKRGFHLVAFYPGAVEDARRIKPEIPPVGAEGIPIRDEIKLELPI